MDSNYKLIICEKPSLAATVAKAIGIIKQNSGYIECRGDYVVTYAFGHLLELPEPKELDEYKGLKWSEYSLPIFPEKFSENIGKDKERKAIDKGKKAQLKIIKDLSKNASLIVNCGDADREGQIIIDNIINYINYRGQVLRLWLPEQTEDTIRAQLSNMKNNNEYINLREEGKTRRYIDWLYGMNTTVFLTIKAGTLLNSGRVLIPIVKYIYDRDIEIKNFKPATYFLVESKLENSVLRCKETFENIDEANNLADNLNEFAGVVTDIKSKLVEKKPRKLFSLSTLQKELSKKYKIEFKESLQVIQKLYEQGYLTYPRTNTEYLAKEEFSKVDKIIDILNKEGYNLINKDKKSIYDDSKIESHSAITPTTKIFKNLDVKSKEGIVYNTVLNRFLANFLNEKTTVNESTMYITIGNSNFKLKGSRVVDVGFYKYEEKEFKDELPNLQINDTFDVDFKAIEKETTPPKLVSENELSNFLENPFKKELKEESDDEDYKAILEGVEIGTVATRTSIIENAVKYGYISKNKGVFSITEKGVKFIEILNKCNINLYKEKSVELSKLLKQVYKGEKTCVELLNMTKTELEKMLNSEVSIEKISNNNNLCLCPECGSDVCENKKTFYCINKECTFVIFKNNKFLESRGIKVSKQIIKDICEKKESKVLNLTSKSGTKYKAKVKYNGLNDKGYLDLSIEFVNNKK